MPQRSAPLSIAGIVILAVVAEGMLTLVDAMIKELSPRYPTFEIAFLRFAFGMYDGRFCLRTVDATRPADA